MPQNLMGNHLGKSCCLPPASAGRWKEESIDFPNTKHGLVVAKQFNAPRGELVTKLPISCGFPGAGCPMGEAVVRRIIKDRTAEALGYPVSPHRFRHAAVMYLATMHPASIAVASDLLGHSHPTI